MNREDLPKQAEACCFAIYYLCDEDGWADVADVRRRCDDAMGILLTTTEAWLLQEGFVQAADERVRLTKTGLDLALFVPF